MVVLLLLLLFLSRLLFEVLGGGFDRLYPYVTYFHSGPALFYLCVFLP
jgi:hypothetical protein